jgi:hypothetical protein
MEPKRIGGLVEGPRLGLCEFLQQQNVGFPDPARFLDLAPWPRLTVERFVHPTGSGAACEQRREDDQP